MNHGIEQHEDVVEYAREKLQEFLKTNEQFDEFEFCEPKFVKGNCLRLNPECNLYDRYDACCFMISWYCMQYSTSCRKIQST